MQKFCPGGGYCGGRHPAEGRFQARPDGFLRLGGYLLAHNGVHKRGEKIRPHCAPHRADGFYGPGQTRVAPGKVRKFL